MVSNVIKMGYVDVFIEFDFNISVWHNADITIDSCINKVLFKA